MLKVDPRESQIEITSRCDHELRNLGISVSWKQGRQLLVNAAFQGGYEPIEEGREIHYLARATVGSKPVVLLLVRREGSIRADRSETVVVRSVFSVSEAERLLSLRAGLLPFIYSLKSGKDFAEHASN